MHFSTNDPAGIAGLLGITNWTPKSVMIRSGFVYVQAYHDVANREVVMRLHYRQRGSDRATCVNSTCPERLLTVDVDTIHRVASDGLLSMERAVESAYES